MYRKELHNLIGEPDLKTFKGAADMAYCALILLNEHKGLYDSDPSWLYRESKFSTSKSSEYDDLNQLVLNEFKKLWERKF